MRMTVLKHLWYLTVCCQCLCLAIILDEHDPLNQFLGPVILVPGDGGCQVQAKWNKPTTVGYFCSKTEPEWSDLWLALSELSPYARNCFVDNLRLVYNKENYTTSNSPGVETRIPGFGTTDTVDYLDTAVHIGITEYFSAITESLVKNGYQKNVTVRGAPFDFRKAPNELHDYFTDLKNLIEETYNINSRLSVTLIAHSMGAPILHSFLNLQSQTWKDTYIQSIISLSGAWGGSIKPVKVYAIGDNLGSRLLSASILRPLQISFPSLAFLMPSRELWGSPEDVIITTPEKNYTIFDIEEYFTALNYTDGYTMYNYTKDVLYNVPPPQVEIHCLHGLQVPTANRLFYPTQNDFPWSPTLLTGDGDGTVNQRSLELCLKWARKQKQKIYHKIFPTVDHMQILTEKTVVDYITKYLGEVQLKNAELIKNRNETNELTGSTDRLEKITNRKEKLSHPKDVLQNLVPYKVPKMEEEKIHSDTTLSHENSKLFIENKTSETDEIEGWLEEITREEKLSNSKYVIKNFIKPSFKDKEEGNKIYEAMMALPQKNSNELIKLPKEAKFNWDNELAFNEIPQIELPKLEYRVPEFEMPRIERIG